MQLHIRERDLITGDLRRRMLLTGPATRREIMEAMGVSVVSMAKRAITSDESLRPHSWPAKKDGSKATLQKSTRLRHSIRVVNVSADRVIAGSDAPYAAIHQLGGKTRPHVIRPVKGKALKIPGLKHPVRFVNHPGSNIPARPYLPFNADGSPTEKAKRNLLRIIESKLGLP